MSFYTIVANYNEASAAATQFRIHINTHKCVTLQLALAQLAFIRSHTRHPHCRFNSSLHDPYTCPSTYTIVANYNEAPVATQTRIHLTTIINNSQSSYLQLNWPSSGRIRDCNIVASSVVCMIRIHVLLYYRYQL